MKAPFSIPTLALLAIFTALLCLWGCMKVDKPVTAQQEAPSSEATEAKAVEKEKAPEKQYYLHTVKHRGETLSFIAKWYTGNSANWRKIAAENPDLNPNRIHVGDDIRIPESMLTTREPLPDRYFERPEPDAKAAKKAIPKPEVSQEPTPPVEVEAVEPEPAKPDEAVETEAAPEASAAEKTQEPVEEPTEEPFLFGPKD